MTYKELYESAIDKLEKSKITLGEFEKMIAPLNAEIATADSDTISRQAAIKATWQDTGYTDPFNVMTAIRDRIQQLPSAQPERIRGRWIEKPHVHGVAYCSLCDYELHTNDTNFCPNCGAEMREVTT